jgi:hypothetical protein
MVIICGACYANGSDQIISQNRRPAFLFYHPFLSSVDKGEKVPQLPAEDVLNLSTGAIVVITNR